MHPRDVVSTWRALLPLLIAAGCSPRYTYLPTTNAVATVQGKVAAEYPIPPSAPQGDVRIASYGMTDVSPSKDSHEVYRALHLRVVLADNSATPWTFDTREQRVELGAREVLPPSFASANGGAPPPLVTVDSNGKRVVDLFFLLPAQLQRADEIPEFDALWHVHTGDGVIAERTPFERFTVEPEPGAHDDWKYGADYYWGGPYWVNPGYPYYGVDYPEFGYFGPGVWIHRSPRLGVGHPGGFHGGAGHAGGHR